MNLPEDSWPPNIDPAVAAQIKGQRPYSVTPEQAKDFLYNNVVSNYLKDKPGSPMPPPGTTPGKIGPPSGPPSGLDIAGGILGDTATQFLTGGLGKVAPALGKLGASALSHGIFVGPAGLEALGGAKSMHPAVWENLKPSLKEQFGSMFSPAAITRQQEIDKWVAAHAPETINRSLSDADQETYHAAAGWGYGADNKLKREIPDTGAKLNLYGNRGLRGLRGLIQSPAGDLHGTFDIPPVMLSGEMLPGSGGASDPKTGQIFLPEGGNPDMNAMLHELQHSIQSASGFAGGASPYTEHKYPDMYRFLTGGAAPSNVARAKLVSDMERMGLPMHNDPHWDAARMAYHISAGENEAENVAGRFSSPGAYLFPPHKTEEIPRSQQIIRFLQSGK